MPFFSQDFLESLSDKADIVDVISDYVTLKNSGRSYVGLCPFHREKTPSFHVDADKQLFHCFGCQASGNVYTFIMKIENLDFVEAVKFLANRVNMPLPEENGQRGVSREKKARLLEANRQAARFYHELLYLPEGAEALNYLYGRGLSDNIIKRFGLGYSPNARNELFKYLSGREFASSELIESGLCLMADAGPRDFFRNRVMFPIINTYGEVIAFGGRVMDKTEPKYLNTGDTPVFNKRKNLYSLNLLKKSKARKAIIAEGYMDVIALNANGYDYAVASLGTALTRDQIKLVSRYAPEIYVSYDGDKAGISATHRAIELARAEKLKVRVISLSGGKDPDEYMRELGPQAYADSMSSAKWGIDYLLDEALDCLDSEEAKAKAAFEGSRLVGQYAFDSIETEMYLKRISQKTGFSIEALYKNIGGRQSEAALNLAGAINARPALIDNAAKRSTKEPQLQAERALLRLLTQEPVLIEHAAQSGLEELLSLPEHKELFRLLKQRRERGEPIGIREISLYYASDAAKSEIISAVYIDNTEFMQPAQYLNDALKRLKRAGLEHERQRLREQLAQYASSSLYLEDEGFKKLLKDIGDLDKKISALKAD